MNDQMNKQMNEQTQTHRLDPSSLDGPTRKQGNETSQPSSTKQQLTYLLLSCALIMTTN
jgi:hypothetical protein